MEFRFSRLSDNTGLKPSPKLKLVTQASKGLLHPRTGWLQR